MSNLSSVTLFHFTSSLETLEKILSEGIRYGMFAEKFPVRRLAYFVRGISFCNIPLSMISEHVEWYGTYAVGLKRSSLREIGVSPVFYVHSKSKMFPRGKEADKILLENPFLCYIKQHYGSQLHKNSGEFKYKKFYDEKEWRIFAGNPTIEKYSTSAELDKIRREKDRIVENEIPMIILPDMIEYIILASHADFQPFDEYLKTEHPKERDEYLTKILYYNQIKRDF